MHCKSFEMGDILYSYIPAILFDLINLSKCFFGNEGHVTLAGNQEPGLNTILLPVIPGDPLCPFPH